MADSTKPISFARMLSWELSRPSVIVAPKNKRRLSSPNNNVSDSSDSSEYYTADESPNWSDSEETDAPLPPVLPVPLPATERRKKGLSKRKKKLRRDRNRIEFFVPFSEGFADDASEAVHDALVEDLTGEVRRIVPTLSEFCIQALWGNPAVRKHRDINEDGHETSKKPFFMERMKLERQAHQCVASVQMKWLHKNLTSIQTSGVIQDDLGYCDRTLQDTFSDQGVGGLFTPLPHPDPAPNFDDGLASMCQLIDLMLEPSGKPAAVYRLKSVLETRHPKLIPCLFDDALPYVWWARGNVTAAVEAFVHRSEFLKTKSVSLCAFYLNEAGRLYSMFGDRQKAAKFFRLACEAVPYYSYPEQYRHEADRRDMVSMSGMALSAAAWDCGVLDGSCAIQASDYWKSVLLCDRIPSPVVEEAILSRLAVHAGKITDKSSSVEIEGDGSDWLDECVKFLLSLVEKYPKFRHHLSLLYALQGRATLARRQHREYIENHAGFRIWNNGQPGSHRGLIFRPQKVWTSVIAFVELLKGSPLPVLKLKWRTRIGNPVMFPQTSYQVANLFARKLTFAVSFGGHLTVDLLNDFPTIRGLHLDLHTGGLCFPHIPHMTTSWFTFPKLDSDLNTGTMFPVPFVLLEVGGRRVEFLQACSESRGKQYYGRSENNLAMLFMTESVTKRRVKLDIRAVIRRKLKEFLLDKAGKEGVSLEDRKTGVDYYFRRGLACLEEYIEKRKPSEPSNANGFHLYMESFASYGRGTIALMFSMLHLGRRGQLLSDVLVIVDCQSAQSFKEPKVYGLSELERFEWIYPIVTADEGVHCHPEIKYIGVKKLSGPRHNEESCCLLFDESGEKIYTASGEPSFSFIWGSRLGSIIEHKMIRLQSVNDGSLETAKESCEIPVIIAVKSLPQALLVLAAGGLFVMQPESLDLLYCDGSTDDDDKQPTIEGEFHKLDIMSMEESEDDVTRLSVSLDYFIVVLEIKRNMVTVQCNVELPSAPSEACLLPGTAGLLVATGLFHPADDEFTEQLFWLSLNGELRGVFPVLGAGPHCFFPLSVRLQVGNTDESSTVLNVYFYDGRGAICCMPLDFAMQ
eukprot:m.282640 g.282640  ORF g.282640 m.282640 type:complete len:1082 (+) comp40659_c0_seq20:48-3293(+)